MEDDLLEVQRKLAAFASSPLRFIRRRRGKALHQREAWLIGMIAIDASKRARLAARIGVLDHQQHEEQAPASSRKARMRATRTVAS